MDNCPKKYESYVKEFWENGYTKIPNFIDDETVRKLLDESTCLVEQLNPSDERCIFETKDNKKQANDYFVNSGDKIRYFYEEGVFNDQGELTVPKERALNKIGHALHWLNPVFKEVTFGENVKRLVREMGYKKPAVVQSMVIFKHRKIGGVVAPHQDASYLYTAPEITAMGFWIALEEATVDNGCLWFIPGSHKAYSLGRRFIRNGSDKEPPLIHTSQEPEYDEKLFVPVPAGKGDCILIHGLTVHKSEANTSEKSRPAYTFHIVDQYNSNWANDNWLQPTNTLPFPALFNEF